MINATVSQDLSRFVSSAACGSRTLDVANHGSVFEAFWIAALRAMATVTLVVSILQTYPMVSIMLFAHRCVGATTSGKCVFLFIAVIVFNAKRRQNEMMIWSLRLLCVVCALRNEGEKFLRTAPVANRATYSKQVLRAPECQILGV